MLEITTKVLWAIATSLIIISSLYFGTKQSFPQFKIKKIIRSLTTNKESNPIKTLYLTLAGRIGVGSIAGVAIGIYIGGPGTIFWMWIIALIAGVLAYTETLIAIKYKEKNYGGPSYYIKKGLNNKSLDIIYSLLIIIAYLIGFIPIQSNTISKSLELNNILLGIILAVVSFIVIKGGLNKITEVTNKLVPFMTIIYIFLSLVTIILNIRTFISIIKTIIISAFNPKSFLGSFISMLLIGSQRCIFSNESGTGIGAIAASSSSGINGCQSGYIQVAGIYITTLLICTSTAFIILISPYNSIVLNNPNGIELTLFAFNNHFGSAGKTLLNILIILFSFTTILTGYYYCESSLNFISRKINKTILKVIVPLSVFTGAVLTPHTIWKLVDIMVALLVIINIYTLYKLRKEILKYHKKYDRIYAKR